MELLQLIYFCDAAETENFTKTSHKYMVPPSNISQSIHRLEEELKCTLFNRSANKVKLNKQGKDFYIHIKKALTSINEAKDSIKEHNNDISGDIKICILTNRRIITEVLEKFKEVNPQISFVINHTYPATNSDFDLIIADDSFKEKNLKKELLITEDIVLAIHKDNPLASKKNISASDLKKQKFITMPNHSSLFNFTNTICQSKGFTPDIAIQSDDPFYLRKYVELGFGIAFIPSLSWQGLFSDNIIFKNIINIKRNTYVFWNNNTKMSYSSKIFFDSLIKHCRS